MTSVPERGVNCRRRWLRLAGKIMFSAALTLLLFEVGLRLCGPLLPPRIGNFIYSAYGVTPAGIYVFDGMLTFQTMKKNFTTGNYFNGYFFDHASDAYGFRNPPGLTDPEVLLVGDSFIFGHGVDERYTVRNVLGQLTGKKVYNLSLTGNCLRQEYILLKVYLPVLQPRQVFLFAFLNDAHDLANSVPAADLKDFPEQRLPFAVLREYLLNRPNPDYTPGERILAHSKTYLLANYLLSQRKAPPAPEGKPGIAASFMDFVASDQLALVRPYYEMALADLAAECRARGAVLHVVNLPTGFCNEPDNRAKRDRFRAQLADICRTRRVNHLDLSEGFGFVESDFLENDGHFNQAGHARLAGVLADYLADTTARTVGSGPGA